MDVNRMRQTEIHRRLSQRDDDLPRRDLKAAHFGVDFVDVVAALLPHLHAARIDEFDGVTLAGGQQPGDERT